ncbi:prepilin peptidase [Catenovulum adriaticum]|uniref:Prepilin leader peptidase/N-methyltransferase n=1 Tax=Catenovulum adriaticum TaxID=2984846 RepID=A0ABY7AJR5_9ALTE|nr:A24 family peptidase [Catenovulum sp. TS8]WAJ69813.1 A24 family peptidase [Catenovulum sp. TS8]
MLFDNIIDVFQLYPLAWYGCAFLISLLIGSFLNVVIYRLPIMLERDWKAECEILLTEPLNSQKQDALAVQNLDESALNHQTSFNLVKPNSTCPHCQTAIKPWHNIPIFSWLALAGKCHSCKAPISIRYPLVELFTGLVGAYAAYHFGVSSLALWAMLFSFILICLCFIDLDTMLLPDQLTLSLIWLGLLANINGQFVDLKDAVIGAVAGYLVLWVVFQSFKLLTNKEGMGFGDFKLLAALGAWMGWQALPIVILLSSVVGAIIGISLIKFQNKDSQTAIPFGPYLAIAGFVAFYWRTEITQYYLQNWVYS